MSKGNDIRCYVAHKYVGKYKIVVKTLASSGTSDIFVDLLNGRVSENRDVPAEKLENAISGVEDHLNGLLSVVQKKIDMARNVLKGLEFEHDAPE